MNEERAAVAVHQLSAGYGKRTVLRDVAFSLPASVWKRAFGALSGLCLK